MVAGSGELARMKELAVKVKDGIFGGGYGGAGGGGDGGEVWWRKWVVWCFLVEKRLKKVVWGYCCC